MPMLGAVLTPHPPVLLPEVGRGREREIAATGRAMEAAAREAARWNPDVLIVASPHTILYGDYFHIAPGSGASGSMSAFGAPQVRFEVRYDAPLREEIIRQAGSAGLEAGTLGQRDPSLDHGVLIPLYYLRKAGISCPMVRMGLSGFSPLDHYRLGQCVARAVEALGRRAVFVASGDLSHKLKADGPYGFAPEGPAFDEAVTQTMASGDFLQFLTMDPGLCDRAAECGLRSFQMMAGALDGLAVHPQLLSHEGTFGVGYAVALFPVTGRDADRCFAPACEAIQKARLAARRANEDPWVRLARLSLETYIRTGHPLDRLPDGLPAQMTSQAAGTFVSPPRERASAGLHRDHRPHRIQCGLGDCPQRRVGGHPGPPVPGFAGGGAGPAGIQCGRAGPARAGGLPRPAGPQTLWGHRQLWPQAGPAAARPGRGGHGGTTAGHCPPKGRHPARGPLHPPAVQGGAASMKIVCDLCFHRCALAEGQTGLCRARASRGGQIVPLNYGRLTALALDPIEKKPLRRFHPGSMILSAGSFGCNLHCPFCQNAEIAAAGTESFTRECSPEQLVQTALDLRARGNIGVDYTYNEPLVGYEYVRDCAGLVHRAGMVNVLVTNGTIEAKPWQALLPLLDAVNIDLKGFTQGWYRTLGGDLETVKRSIALL